MADRRSVLSLFLGFCLTLLATSVFAQQGHISGRITRTNGSGIGGVIVQVVEISKVELSDANGNFSFAVPAGTYNLQFVAGEQAVAENNVSVTAGNTTRVDKQVDWNLSVAETITVYSASRRTERVVDAPAAVTVVSQEDIEAVAASGQAPRIIESAPGVDFTQSGLYDTNFNARGFNSSLNRRILTLIDGRDPAIAFLGAQEWAALSMPIDEMASVELVRGPGSALYGPNAFSGVLNMTTKQPKLTQGGRVTVSGGDLATRRADIRHAGDLGSDDAFYRFTAGYQESEDFSRSRNAGVEYPGLRAEARALALDEVQIAFGGLRFDKHFQNTDVLTLEGGYSTIEGPVFQTGIGRVQVTDVSRPWARVNYNKPHWNFGGYYDARNAKEQVALSSGALLFEDSSNLHAELQTNWDLIKGRLRVAGGVAMHNQDVDTSGPGGVQTLMTAATSEQQQAVFGQFEYDLTNKLKFVGAGRWDDSTLHEAQFSPKASLVFAPSTNHTLRYGYNKAFQRPNYSELFLAAPAGAPVNLAAAAAANPAAAPLAPALTALQFNALPILARGNADLDVEKVESHEVGYSGILGGKLFLTVDVYKSSMSDFVTDLLPGVNGSFVPYTVPTNVATIPPPVQGAITNFLRAALGNNYAGLTTVGGRPAIVFSYTNAGEVDSQGAEIAMNYYVTNNWLVDFNYSYFDFDVKSAQLGDQLLPNAPENKFNLGIGFRSTKFDAKVMYRWVEEYKWAAGIFVGTVPQYDVINASANYKMNDRFGFGVDISNLLDEEHYEAFGGDILSRRALGFVTVNW